MRLVEGQIQWTFRLLPKVRCLAAMLHLVFLLVEWRINCDVSFACLLLTGDCSRNSKSHRWYLESRQGFENRGISNALKIERGRIREANERVVVGGHAPHKNSWCFLSEFRGRSCDARLFCINASLFIAY